MPPQAPQPDQTRFQHVQADATQPDEALPDQTRPDQTPPPDEWRRLHPISPFLRGGVMILAVGGYFISQRIEDFIGFPWGPSGPDPGEVPFGGIWLAVLATLALVAVVVFYGWLSWRVAKFRIGQSKLEYRWGLLFKQHRQVRYDRIQSVDITRPLLARLFGLSQVVVQSAGGSDSQVELAYLTHPRALVVRDAVLSRVDAEEATTAALAPTGAGEGSAAAADVGTAYSPLGLDAALRGTMAPTRGRQVLRTLKLPTGRLILSLLYHPITVIVLIAVPAILVGSVMGSVALLPALFPVAFGLVLPHVRRFLTEANFSVDVESDRLRITYGLTTQRSNTVPLARIQAVEISQGWFWRWPDWWRMKVTIAGVAGEDTDSQTTAFPVGTEEEVLDLAQIALPGIDRDSVLAGMRGTGEEPGFTNSSRSAAVFQPWAWRRNGYAVSESALIIRRGRLARVVSLVPHARVQSLSVAQGPLDRWRHVASVQLDLTAGPVSGAVEHLDVTEARRLLAEQSSRSALARNALRAPLPLGARRGPGPGEPAEAMTEGFGPL